MKKLIVALTSAVVVALCILVTACAQTFAGTYKFKSMSMTSGGISINYEVGKEYNGVTINEDAITLVVKEDNTFTMSMNMMGQSANQDGTWEEVDGKYYFSADGEKFEVKRDGNKVIFAQNGAEVVLQK